MIFDYDAGERERDEEEEEEDADDKYEGPASSWHLSSGKESAQRLDNKSEPELRARDRAKELI